MQTPPRDVQIAEQIRVCFPNQPEILAEVLKTLRLHGGNLVAHLVYELQGQAVGLFVCERPQEAHLTLEAAGLKPERQTVLVVRTDNRWGAVSHLLKVLFEEGIRVGYSQATAGTGNLCVVLTADDIVEAERALRHYLILADDPAGVSPAGE